MEDYSKSPTLYYLIEIVLKDSGLNPDEKKLLIDELRKNNPGIADRWAYRWAIYIFGGLSALSIIGLIFISSNGHSPPDGLVAIGSASVGGMAGLLTHGQARN